jgi:hypothetical protein
MELWYSYSPLAYIRELSDRPPFTSRVVPLAWLSFKSTRNAFRLALASPLTSRISARFEGERVMRFYNRPFLENDNWEWNASGALSVSLSRAWRVTTEYQYANTKTRSHDSVGESRGHSDDGDGSYTRDQYVLGLRYRPRGGFWRFDAVEATGRHQAYYFTSDLPYYDDPVHVGRKDEVWSGEATLGTKPVWGPVTLEVGYRYTERSSSAASSLVGADSIEEDKNYSNNRTWLGMTWPF